MLSRCPLEKDSEHIKRNIASWKNKNKQPTNLLVASSIHLTTGEINTQELGEIVLADSNSSPLTKSRKYSNPTQTSVQTADNLLIDSLYCQGQSTSSSSLLHTEKLW